MIRIIASILIALAIILLIIFTLDINDKDWSVFGQTVSNITTTTAAGTPAINTAVPIATTDDLSDQFQKFVMGLVGTGTVAGGGVATLWAKFRGKAKRIDAALRAQDFDNKDLLDHINTIFESAKDNPEMPLGKIIMLPAFRDKKLMNKSIAEAWATDYDEYNEWFTKRYTENPN